MVVMEERDYEIRTMGIGVLETLMAYLEDHVKDNGRKGVALFQPQSRETAWLGAERIGLFRAGLEIPVGAPSWRRAWGAITSNGHIAGHVDLRAHPEPCTSHRALLGIGVHRDHRRRGLGRVLVEHAISWALQETGLEWIDLNFVGGNVPAEKLYRSVGFEEIAMQADMFRIDGESIHKVIMAKRIRPVPAKSV
jgi:GNAT superfamily N-acetyltransferase